MDVDVADILRQSGWRAATMTMAANASLIRHAAPMSQAECPASSVGASSKMPETNGARRE
jgi:hypothetical protein